MKFFPVYEAYEVVHGEIDVSSVRVAVEQRAKTWVVLRVVPVQRLEAILHQLLGGIAFLILGATIAKNLASRCAKPTVHGYTSIIFGSRRPWNTHFWFELTCFLLHDGEKQLACCAPDTSLMLNRFDRVA